MKSIICLISILVFAACNPERKKEKITERLAEAETSPTAAVLPALTDQQEKEGWKILFDGKSLNGWHTYQQKENNSWEAGGGTLHCKPFADNADNKRSDLITNDEFENYELTWEWKVAAKSNSGIIYRATEQFDQPYKSGPEYQMIDDHGADGKLEPWQKSGGCYGMYPPIDGVTKAVGEWNSSKIIVNNNHVEHWLNGAKVVDYEIGSAEWLKKKSGSKWKDEKGYGTAKKTRIDLQDHSSETWFRNIFIKVIK